MKQNKLKLFFYSLSILTLSFTFLGGDCSTNEEEEPPTPNSVASPGSFTFKVEAEAGGDSKVTFNWTASSDENDNDFEGYRIITIELDSNGNEISVFQIQALGKTVKFHSIDPLERGKRFKTFLLAEKNDGTKSDSLETGVYAGVFYNINGEIDSYEENISLSGFGWNFSNGVGTQYPYTQSNASKIDLHVEKLGNDPFFFSPSLTSGFKLTRIKNIGSGQAAFDDTNLPEVDETFLLLNLGDVYLVKTQEGYYAKIWIKSITPPNTSQTYYTIIFDYKLQPIKGLRIL